MLVSAAIVAANFRQLYIGIDFTSSIGSETINIALLQTAAKLQELLIIASLATIVFQLVRDELIYGDGLPLGLVGAGLDFTKLSFFWSPEIIGSLNGFFKGRRKYRKLQLLIFLVVAGVLAVLAGPACAVLLVPQSQDWPAGGTSFFLNGTRDEFWPSKLALEPSPLSKACSSSNGTRYALCLSGGFRSLWYHYSGVDPSTFTNIVQPYAKDLSGNRYYRPMRNLRPAFIQTISLGIYHGNPFIIQPHLAVAILLDQLMQDWWKALLLKYRFKENNIDDRKAIAPKILSPIANVHCAPAQILRSTNYTIQFPSLQSADPFVEQLNGSTLPDHPTSHLRFSWVALPKSLAAVSTGAILQSGWDSENQTRLVVGCSVQAQWVPADIQTDAYTFWQGWYPKNISFEAAYPTKGDQLFQDGSTSLRSSIAIESSWLNALTPATPTEGPGYHEWGPSTIESLISAAGLTDGLDIDAASPLDLWESPGDTSRPDLLASIIASVFADGLSRVNVAKLYDTHESPLGWSLADYGKEDNFDDRLVRGHRALRPPNVTESEFSELKVDFAISGLSYRLTLAQKLSLAVLFLHMAIAVSHTLWTIGRGKSSACWDSFTEYFVLAQNSRPAYHALENTAAGLKHSSTFARRVAIRATRTSSFPDADHLEVIYDEPGVNDENELMDMDHHGRPPSRPVTTSLVRKGRSASTKATISHPSTWPIYRERSIPASTRSSIRSNDDQMSELDTPLLGSSAYNPHSLLVSEVKEDHAYG
ncbi:MAG: hypothetical protein LQ351_003044 [Letrouitia transgressa]|nr:MAG: hypothetical protein LQ351_003044 [Letrouitia transgressa]